MNSRNVGSADLSSGDQEHEQEANVRHRPRGLLRVGCVPLGQLGHLLIRELLGAPSSKVPVGQLQNVADVVGS
jgi:hypothetical protein